MPNDTYIGIDLASRKASVYAVTRDGQEFETGTITLETLPELLARVTPEAVAAEHTGGIAERWMRATEGAGYEFYLIHSTERKGLNRVAHQAHKDDKRDARSIAKALRMWHRTELRSLVGIHADIFTRAIHTARAWELRNLLRSANAITRERTAAKQRLASATLLEREVLAEVWEEKAKSKAPEAAQKAAESFTREWFPRELQLLTGIPGIGPWSAMWLIATLCPIERFVEYGPGFRLRDRTYGRAGKPGAIAPSAAGVAAVAPCLPALRPVPAPSIQPAIGRDLTIRNVKRYLGLNPHVEQSGDTARAEFIQRLGAKEVRSALYIGAMGTLQHAELPTTEAFKAAKAEYESKPTGQRGRSQGRKLVVRIVLRQVRLAVSALRSGQPYRGPGERIAPTKWEPPAHLISQAEAARLLGVSRQWVGQLVSNGDLQTEQVQRPCPKPGGAAKGTRMVLRSSIEARLEVSPCTK